MANFQNPKFLRSTWSIHGVASDVPIVVFAGRSNVGKSSVLNILCAGKFARTARLPGRTRAINLFELLSGEMLADLPGYGYAVGPREEKKEWGEKLPVFLRERNICGAVLVVDCRRGLQERDITLLDMLTCSSLVLMNKADKLGKVAMRECLQKARKDLELLAMPPVVLEFSVLKKIGAEDARKIVSGFMDSFSA
ncbi:MAG: ribosome biogenesis GTP-binding protein YihA/YsxC [Gammaproteobacteria bacterium WSBS_2016_MAG_OTU1]